MGINVVLLYAIAYFVRADFSCSDVLSENDISHLSGDWEFVDIRTKYILNLCGSSSTCSDGILCARNFTSKDGNVEWETKTQSVLISTGQLSITSDNGRYLIKKEGIEIELLCENRPMHSIYPPELIKTEISSSGKHNYYISWRSSVVCPEYAHSPEPSPPAKCYTFDQANRLIDLTPLAGIVFISGEIIQF